MTPNSLTDHTGTAGTTGHSTPGGYHGPGPGCNRDLHVFSRSQRIPHTGWAGRTRGERGVDVRRLTAPAALPLLLAGVLVASLSSDSGPDDEAAEEARGLRCRPTPDLLAQPPDRFRLPGGASVRIWDTGPRKRTVKARKAKRKPARLHLAVVTVPRQALVPRVATAPTLARAVPLAAMVRGDRRSVVALNGGHFFARVPGIPTKSQISNGEVRKGIRVPQTNVAVYAAARHVTLARVKLTGALRVAGPPVPIAAVNWQRLPPRGVAVYTHDWGARPHPAGPRTVVVAGDEVRAVVGPRRGKRRPPPSQTYVTAAPGPYAKALRRLEVGDPVEVSISPAGRRVAPFRPRPPIGEPSGLLGVGGTLVEQGVNRSVCNRRNETPRPRSMLGWRRDGSMLVAAASGRGPTRSFGLTVHQGADLLRKLGAVRVVNFDGGSSTTLLVRKKLGGPLVRIDRPWADRRPPVVDGLAFRKPPS
jgi:hypothetical protein